MEIECKFGIPDEQAFERLLETPTLAGFSLSPASLSHVSDHYLDTADLAIRASGFAFRERQAGTRIVATLKGLGGASGAVHRREEYETELPEPLRGNDPPLLPGEWPSSPVRDLVLRLCGSAPLFTLFEIEQARHTRLLVGGARAVAEVSLDRVTVCYRNAHGCPVTYLELEAELLPDGSEEELRELAAELQEVWGLRPESQSKYERALALLAEPGATSRASEGSAGWYLTSEERAVIEGLTLEREVIARRARLLLAWDDGVSRAELSQRSGLSPRRIRYWLGLFPQARLAVFPGRVVDSLRSTAAGPVSASTQASALSNAEARTPVTPGHKPQPVGEPDAVVVAEEAASERPAAPEPAVKGAGLIGTGHAVRLPKLPGIEPDDPMSEAGRKTLRFHYQRMLFHEPGTRAGEDIEALHDMRVATRRMRAAFRIFEPYFEPKVLIPHLKGLRRTGTALGAVRDLDVFREKLHSYAGCLPESQQGSLDGLLSALEQQRAAARERLVAYLDGGKYRRFVDRFGEFVGTDTRTGTGGLGSLSLVDHALPKTVPAAAPAGEPRPYRVRHVVPMAVYERLAEIQGYDEWVSIPNPPLDQLHALRIACKRFRYTVEFFAEVLGADAKGVVKEIVIVQDHLGALQDAVVASAILRDYLVWGTWGSDTAAGSEAGARRRQPDLNSTVVSPGVAAYLAAKHSEMRQLLDAFPAVWLRLQGPELSYMVAQAVMAL